jgi:RNA polymerase sigma factor (sigma-70 family)
LALLKSCPLSDQAARASPDREEYLEDGEVKPQVFLSADQERELARRYREGDEKAGHELACAYLPLVKRIAGEFFGSREDLVSEGCVGLMKAIRGYDPDHGARLGTYATIWIEAEIREYTLRQANKLFPKEDGWKRAPFEEIEWLADEQEDQEQMLGDRQEQKRRREFLKKALNSLPDPERQIIMERHLRQQATPLKDLGSRFGLSGESIRQIELKALKTLKTMRGMAAA